MAKSAVGFPARLRRRPVARAAGQEVSLSVDDDEGGARLMIAPPAVAARGDNWRAASVNTRLPA
jgi:hypothetical protein